MKSAAQNHLTVLTDNKDGVKIYEIRNQRWLHVYDLNSAVTANS